MSFAVCTPIGSHRPVVGVYKQARKSADGHCQAAIGPDAPSWLPVRHEMPLCTDAVVQHTFTCSF